MRTILGLDLGTNSIGWAVINSVIKEQTERIWIEMAGSRIIPMDALSWETLTKGILYHRQLKEPVLEGCVD